MPGINRREFFRLTGSGIVVFVALGPTSVLAQQRRPSYPEDFNAYLLVGENGRVSIFSGKIEMGQGVMTSQAQMAAEELGVALDAIDMIMGDTDRCVWDMGTFGSLTTRMFGPALRAAAAEARSVLTQLAAQQLGVAKDQIEIENGVAYVRGDRTKKVSYGELAKGKQIARVVGEKAVLRAAKDFTVMGRSPKRLDATEKVTGRAKYAGDIRLPGMLYARILRPPAHGATLKSVDTSGVKNAQVVKQDDLVAVLASDPEVAARAHDQIKATWTTPDAKADHETIHDYLVKAAPEGEAKTTKGDVVATRAAATKLFESTFKTPYHAHAPMEPHTALAEFKDGKMTVWASTQTPFPTRDAIAKALGLDAKNVRVITPYVGGGFGGKSASRQAIEAARLAQLSGKPVQVMWTRPEEFFFDTFNPASVIKVASALDANGKINLWDYHVYYAGERGSALFYDIPNAKITVSGGWSGGTSAHPFAVGPWRAPGANMNVFAAESQIDIMAHDAGVDPLAFRLKNTSDPRMIRVLKAAAEKFGWDSAGKGRGLACGIDAGTYVALMAKVHVENGVVKVDRILAAQDMGLIVNPDGARMQMEGCMTMGLGYVLSEGLRFKGGDVLDRNFGTYRLPRFSHLPKIETVLVPNDELAPQGGGEPAIICMGAVIANALFDATGRRAYSLPL